MSADEKINSLQKNEIDVDGKMRKGVMVVCNLSEDIYRDARYQGRAETLDLLSLLLPRLIQDGRQEELSRINEPGVLDALLEEYNLF